MCDSHHLLLKQRLCIRLEVLIRFGLFWFGSGRFFIFDQFRLCMLCSVVIPDLLCNYVAFSSFQVVLVVLVFQDV